MLPDDERGGSNPENDIADAWRREISWRLQQIDSGEVELIPWEEAERRLWSKVRDYDQDS